MANEFIEEKLEEYNENTKRLIIDYLHLIEDGVDEINDFLNDAQASSSRYYLLGVESQLAHINQMVRMSFHKWLVVERMMNIISPEEYNENNEENPIKMFKAIENVKFEHYKDLIETKQFYPTAGSYAYCECMGYDDLTRSEMGRVIKNALSKEYPDIAFSVTTSEGMLHDHVTISYSRIPERYVEMKIDHFSLVKEFYDELDSFLMRFQPRVRIYIESFMKREVVCHG